MIRRTKIVATLGPAIDEPAALEALLRAGVDVVRLNLSHGADRRAPRAAGDGARGGRRRRPARSACWPTCPARRSAPASSPTAASSWRRAASCASCPATGRATPSRRHRRLPDAARPTSIPATASCSATARISMRVVAATDDGRCWPRSRAAGGTQGRPGVHLSCERLQMRAPTAQDLELAEAVAAAGVEYVALSFVRRAADVARAARRRRRPGRHRGQDRDRRSALAELAAITEAADAVMVARGDLGIDCPLEDVPHLQKRIIRHCVEVGPARDHGDADAGVDDRRPVADPGRGQRRRQRRVRRHRRRDAVGRDGDRARPGAASWRRWPGSPRGPRPRPATGSGPSGSAGSSARGPTTSTDRITRAVTHAAWQAAHDAGATAILCCTRSGRTARAMARFRPGVPARSGCRPTRARSTR